MVLFLIFLLFGSSIYLYNVYWSYVSLSTFFQYLLMAVIPPPTQLQVLFEQNIANNSWVQLLLFIWICVFLGAWAPTNNHILKREFPPAQLPLAPIASPVGLCLRDPCPSMLKSWGFDLLQGATNSVTSLFCWMCRKTISFFIGQDGVMWAYGGAMSFSYHEIKLSHQKRICTLVANYCEITPSCPKEQIRVTDDFLSVDIYYRRTRPTFQSEEPLI